MEKAEVEKLKKAMQEFLNTEDRPATHLLKLTLDEITDYYDKNYMEGLPLGKRIETNATMKALMFDILATYFDIVHDLINKR